MAPRDSLNSAALGSENSHSHDNSLRQRHTQHTNNQLQTVLGNQLTQQASHTHNDQLTNQLIQLQQLQQTQLLNPTSQTMTTELLFNRRHKPPPTMADAHNFIRYNPRSVQRYQVDIIVRQLERTFANDPQDTDAQAEARALRTLHQNMNHYDFTLLLQNYFQDDNHFHLPYNMYWRHYATNNVHLWHCPDPQRADLATALSQLTRLVTGNTRQFNNDNNNNRQNNFQSYNQMPNMYRSRPFPNHLQQFPQPFYQNNAPIFPQYPHSNYFNFSPRFPNNNT